METALDILLDLAEKGESVFDRNKRLDRLSDATTESMDDWSKFLALANDSNAISMGWLQNVGSFLFVCNGSIFTSAIRADRILFRSFAKSLLGVGSRRCILPLYEPLAAAIEETRDMREVKASISVILGLTREAGEALRYVMLLDAATLGKYDLQKLQRRQTSNFLIGVNRSLKILREFAAGNDGDDGWWADAMNMI